MEKSSSFALWLKQQRRRHDLTQRQLADLVACSPSAIQKMEIGARRPSRELAEQIAGHLGLSAAETDAVIRLARSTATKEQDHYTHPVRHARSMLSGSTEKCEASALQGIQGFQDLLRPNDEIVSPNALRVVAMESDDGYRLYAGLYLTMVEQSERHLAGSEQSVWLKRLENERHNIDAVLYSCLARGDTQLALRITGGLWRFWNCSGRLIEGRQRLSLALSEAKPEVGASRAKALYGAGALARSQADLEEAWILHAESGSLRISGVG